MWQLNCLLVQHLLCLAYYSLSLSNQALYGSHWQRIVSQSFSHVPLAYGQSPAIHIWHRTSLSLSRQLLLLFSLIKAGKADIKRQWTTNNPSVNFINVLAHGTQQVGNRNLLWTFNFQGFFFLFARNQAWKWNKAILWNITGPLETKTNKLGVGLIPSPIPAL